MFGTLAGPAWSLHKWPAVAALALALFLVCGLLVARLWHIRPDQRRAHSADPDHDVDTSRHRSITNPQVGAYTKPRRA
jgi:hypothetical protein